MRNLLKIFLLILPLSFLTTGSGISQITTSPYSVFGLGYLEGSSSGPSRAMGGTGIAFLSGNSVNFKNPASYSGIDSLLTIFEVGLFGRYTIYSTGQEDQSLFNSNLKQILMGFRVTPWLTTSFGFAPYSSIGYKINTTSTLVGTNTEFPATFQGEGGINRVFIGASVNLIKNLSAGFNASYLFGNITRAESSDAYSYYLEDITYLSNFNFNYGLNYQINIKDWKYNIGLTYNALKKLRTNNTTTISTDYQTEVLKSRSYKYSIPQTIGAGLAVTKGYFSAGADYEWGKWGEIEFNNTYLDTRNSNRFSFGLEFPSLGIRKGSGRMFFYRFGAEYRQSYMVIKGIPINYRAVTFGTGIPLRGVLSVVNASIELGQNGTTRKDLFRETFITLNLDLSLRAIWFEKRRYN